MSHQNITTSHMSQIINNVNNNKNNLHKSNLFKYLDDNIENKEN